MKEIKGMDEAFKNAKQIFLMTMSPEGEKNVRPMTNYNDSPYQDMWFPSFRDTRKIEDIEANKEVVISFPSVDEGKWYRVKGIARLAPWEEVRKMWRWWLLEWLPEEDRRPLRYDNPFMDRSIIWVKPKEAEVGDSR